MPLSRAEILKTATAEASRVLAKCNYSYQEPVDVFTIVESDNIILNFQPLGNLAGAYLPPGNEEIPAGILVNEKLPLTKQRYTVAHEYCHHLRNDEASLDTSQELFIQSYKRDDQEKIAETFASCLLMPRGLVLRLLKKMNFEKNKLIGPMEAYSLSLRLGTSYSATISRLANMELITTTQYKRMEKITPKKLKEELGNSDLETSWNDIWSLTATENESKILPRQGDKLSLGLMENPSTGYKWVAVMQEEHLELLSSHWVPTVNGQVGSAGERQFVFKVNEPGDTKLELSYCRPWNQTKTADRYWIHLGIQKKLHGISEALLMG